LLRLLRLLPALVRAGLGSPRGGSRISALKRYTPSPSSSLLGSITHRTMGSFLRWARILLCVAGCIDCPIRKRLLLRMSATATAPMSPPTAMDPTASYMGSPVAQVSPEAMPATASPATAPASSARMAAVVGSRPFHRNCITPCPCSLAPSRMASSATRRDHISARADAPRTAPQRERECEGGEEGGGGVQVASSAALTSHAEGHVFQCGGVHQRLDAVHHRRAGAQAKHAHRGDERVYVLFAVKAVGVLPRGHAPRLLHARAQQHLVANVGQGVQRLRQ